MTTPGAADPLPPPLGEGRGGGSRAATSPAQQPTALSALAALNAHIAQASQAARDSAPAANGPWPELRSAQRFKETWERIGAEVQVQQARDRAPTNAGPLNPQRLMLETLARMGELSPHYLRRFLAHTETLLWLEQVQGPGKAAQASAPTGRPKPSRNAAQKK